MFDIALICSSIEARKPLLDRSLQTWLWDAEQSGLSVAIRIYCDGFIYPLSGEVAWSRAADVDITYSHKPSGSHITGYNYWWKHTEAKVYIFTHPEILFPRGTLRTAFEMAQPNTFAAFKVFWLPQYVTEELHLYPWQTPELLEEYEEIYRTDPKQHGEYYWNRDTRSRSDWHSTTTFAMARDTLAPMMPLPEFGKWGSDDPYQLALRYKLGIKDVTIMEPILFHQWHPTLQRDSIEDIVAEAQEAIRKRFG